MVDLAVKRLEQKNRKKYPDPCILIINAEPKFPVTPEEWVSIIQQVRNRVADLRFSFVYMVDAGRNDVFCEQAPSPV